jgi:hypothetical protein
LKQQGRQKSDNDEAAKREKVVVWDEMKILSSYSLSFICISHESNFFFVPEGFTRTFTALYSVTLLTILIRIQINLIGRHTYRDSVAVNEAKKEKIDETEVPKSLSEDIERAYMTFTWHFLNSGITQLVEAMRGIVTDVVGG